MQPLFTANKSACAIGQNWSRYFDVSDDNTTSEHEFWLNFLFNTRLENGHVFNSNHWIHIFDFSELLLQGKLLFIRVYTQEIWRAFWHTVATCTRPENFPSFKHVWTLGSLYINATLIRRLCSVFLFEFLKRISTLCQIYWILDLQSLKLVCFEVKNTGRETMQISGCQWQNDVYSIEESVLPTRENTPNTGWILLILY